jgi:hypothetical protein
LGTTYRLFRPVLRAFFAFFRWRIFLDGYLTNCAHCYPIKPRQPIQIKAFSQTLAHGRLTIRQTLSNISSRLVKAPAILDGGALL